MSDLSLTSLSSTVFTADARYVLSGSDDGNIRIWKARAADKLGVVTTREKAAMEYRDSLRERWKMDPEVGKVIRLVTFPFVLIPKPTRLSLGVDTFPNLFTRRRSSNILCWNRGGSRRNGGENTPVLGKANQKQRKRKQSLCNKPKGYLVVLFPALLYLIAPLSFVQFFWG
jgi:WD40 repeat protein